MAMSTTRKQLKRGRLITKAAKAFRDMRGGRDSDIPLSDFVVKDAIKFKTSIAGFLGDDETPIGYADCTDLINSRLSHLSPDSPDRHHQMQEALYEFAKATATKRFSEPQNMPFVLKVGDDVYLLTFYDDQEKSPRLTNVLELYHETIELKELTLKSVAAKIANLTAQRNEGEQFLATFLALQKDVVSKRKTLPQKMGDETINTLEEIDIRIESIKPLLADINFKLRKEKKEETQVDEQLELLSNGQLTFYNLIDSVEFPKATSKTEEFILPVELNIITLTAARDLNILLFLPDYSYAVQPALVKRTLNRTLEFSKKQLGTSGTGVTLADIRRKISPLAAAMQGAGILAAVPHAEQQEKLKIRAAQIALESAAECRDFATIAYAKLLEILPANIRILMMSDGLHNFVIVGYEGAIPGGKLSLEDLDKQKDNIILVDLWLLAMAEDTESWGVYTLDRYRPRDVVLKVTFDSQPTPESLKSFLTSSELRRDALQLESPRSTTSSFSSFSGESVDEEIPLSRRSIFSSARSTTSFGSGSQRAPEEEPYAPTSSRTTRGFLTSSVGVSRGTGAPSPSQADTSPTQEERRTRTLGSRTTAPITRPRH